MKAPPITPSPWKLGSANMGPRPLWNITKENGVRYVTGITLPMIEKSLTPEQEANIRMAAASPQMAEALLWLLNRAVLEGCEWKEMDEANDSLLVAGYTEE